MGQAISPSFRKSTDFVIWILRDSIRCFIFNLTHFQFVKLQDRKSLLRLGYRIMAFQNRV
jgi:hypothetical protein